MLDLPPHAAKVAVEVAAPADLPASLRERAEAILDPLRRVIPFHGYDDRIRAYMTTREDYDEIESLGLHGPTPLRIRGSRTRWIRSARSRCWPGSSGG